MTTDSPANRYERAYNRLETELVDVCGQQKASSKPAVLAFPDDASITAEELNDAISTEELVPVAPFIDDDAENGFYYAASRIYRPEAEPDISIRADADELRVFEAPRDEEEPLPELTFEEFRTIIDQLEENLNLTFEEYEELDE